MVQALNEMTAGKNLRSSDVSLELITAIKKVGIQVMAETCHSPRWTWNAS